MRKTRHCLHIIIFCFLPWLTSVALAQVYHPDTIVGAIEGSGGPSGLGGATYTIPIKVPDGLGGLQPSVAVSYNSQGGNGLLGWCWDLQGTSSITRTGTTLYHDGTVSGVDFDNDRFMLDGQRLICVSGTYGANNAEYRTEMDGMAKIVSYTCDTADGPAYFKVWLPNGNIAYYGNSDDSRIGLQQRHDACLWLLNRVEDRNGNYAEYHYNQWNAGWSLARISYGGNSEEQIGCRYTVRFVYSDKDDREISFVGDNTIDHKKRLDTIKVSRGSQELHRYWFDYDEPTPANGYYYTRLKQVNFQCGYEAYRPTVIQWGANDYGQYGSSQCHNISVVGGSPSDFNGRIKFTGDLNGDGYTDVIVYFPDIDEDKAVGGASAKSKQKAAVFYINKGLDSQGACRFSRQAGYIELDDNIDWIYTSDLNGDGLDDIVLSNRKRTLIGKDKLTLSTYLSSVDANGAWHITAATQTFGEYRIKKKYRETILVGDFLGEGKQSLLLQECDDNKAEPRLFYITYSNSNGTLSSLQLPQHMVLDADRMFACDFNGEGISEIYYMNEDTHSTGLLRMRRSGSTYSYETVNSNMLSPWHQIFPGDFNGDGKPDLLTYVEDGHGNASWHLNYFMESNMHWPAFNMDEQVVGIGNPGTHGYSLKYFDEPDYKFITVGDFNGDGKADVAVRTQNDQMRFLYGPVRNVSGEGQFAGSQTVSLSDIGMSGVSNQTICTGNFLGRENMSVFSATTVHALNPVSNRYSVTAVTDGMGNRTEFEYDYLMPKPSGASDADFYTRTVQTASEQAAHMFTVPLPMKGMSKMACHNVNCQSPVVEVTYRYGNALVHKRGRGFLGFKAATTENWLASTKQQSADRSSETLFNVPFLALRTENVKSGNGTLVSFTENQNTILQKLVHGKLCKAFVPVVKRQKTVNYDIDHAGRVLNTTITENGYNDTSLVTNSQTVWAYELLKQTDTRQGVDSSGSAASASVCEFQTLTHTEYVEESPADLQEWTVNRPRSTSVTSRRLGGYDDVGSLSVFRYHDAGNPFLVSCVLHYPGGVEDPDNPLATYDSTAYSPLGLVTDRISGDLASTLPQRHQKYCYSWDGRFMTDECNSLGHVTSYEHDPYYGFPLSETDCNGLETTHTTTPLGAWTRTRFPDGVYSWKSTHWVYEGDLFAPAGAWYCQVHSHTDKRYQCTYYDASGKTLRIVTTGMHKEIMRDFTYNDKGLLIGESLPYYYGADTVYWTHYGYDAHDRHYLTEHPDGFEEVTMFDGPRTWHVSYTDPDDPPSTATVVNAAGWVVKSVDEERNEVLYDYYADGKLKTTQIGNDCSTRVSIGYDAAGNRTMLNDPDYGTVRSVYNAFGQLTATTNPSGETTTYEYDILGRMVKKIEEYHHSFDSTVWTYSESHGTTGLLASVEHNGNEQVITYSYDSLNRIGNICERRVNEYHNTHYTYDYHSRVSSITYPSGFVLRKEYTSTGHLVSLYNGSSEVPLWTTDDKNAFGQVIRHHTGDGSTTTREYDPTTGRLVGIVTHRGNDTLQNLSYVYDKIANLAVRKDNKRDMEERFTYDWLNRLTGVIENGDTTGVFVYDDYGRMTMKRLHGEMVFDSTAYGADGRPHAIESANMYAERPDQRMRYTAFDKLQSIEQTDPVLLVDCHLLYDYGNDHQRIRMTEAVSLDTIVKEYVGNCEFVRTNGNVTSELTFLSGPLGVFAVLDSHIQPMGKGMYYVHPDHLGSWTTVTDRNGAVVQDVWFDPWGTPYYSDSDTLTQVHSLLFDRGFTGHEHMAHFGLINMNGRVYDPVTSTFLSVDNYVQDPSYTQNFNRYAYCMNNPLKYTDPDGEWAHLVIGALVGGIVNLATNWGHINTFGEGLAYFGIGAAAGAVGAATGGAAAGAMKLGGFVSGAVSGAAGGASSGFITGSGNAWMQGANFGQGLKAGAIAAGIGAGSGALFGGLTRGIVDYRKGYNFWDGTKITNYEGGTVKLSELYPNNNFNYDNYQIKECADFTDLRLKTRTSQVFGIEQGDMGIELLTTNPNNAVGPSKGYTLLTDGTYQTADGRNSLGYTFETTTGYSEVHVSPYAATHRNTAIFKAVVGHELTHSYHYFVNLPVSELGPSEGAALRYSAKVYQSYGMTAAYEATVKSIQTVPYYPNYAVPNTYTFSLKW